MGISFVLGYRKRKQRFIRINLFNIMKNYLFSKFIIFFGLSVTTSHAVLVWNGGTDGSGNFQGSLNSWTGDGTVQTSVTSNPAEDASALLIDNFSSGALSITFNSQARLETIVTGTIDITIIGGGTADLFMNNRNNFDGGNDTWEGLRFGEFTGTVLGIEATISFDSPIASRNHNPIDNTRPMIAGLAVTDLDGTSDADYEITTSLEGVFSDPANDDNFVADLSPAFDSPVLIGGLTGSDGSTTATASGFSGTNNFLIIRGFDDNGNTGGNDTAFRDRTYVYSQTWNLTRDGGVAFATGSEFIFSMDAAQYTNFSDVPALPVPEPSVALSLVGGLFALLMRRSRT